MVFIRVLKRILCNRKKQSIFNTLKFVGEGVEFDLSTEMVYPERITLGSHVYVGPNSYLNGRGGLEIHDHVIIAPQVVVMTSMHNYQNADMLPYDCKELLDPVIIEKCAWVGMRAIIMPGVKIREGSIIGAGAVVTKSCDPGSILGGNPARVIGTRDMVNYGNLLQHNRFYLKLKQTYKFDKEEVARNLCKSTKDNRKILTG